MSSELAFARDPLPLLIALMSSRQATRSSGATVSCYAAVQCVVSSTSIIIKTTFEAI